MHKNRGIEARGTLKIGKCYLPFAKMIKNGFKRDIFETDFEWRKFKFLLNFCPEIG